MKTKRLAAATTAMLLALTSIAAMASPAAADHEQSCQDTHRVTHVQTGTREVPVYDDVGNLMGYEDEPVYTTKHETVTVCTTIDHRQEDNCDAMDVMWDNRLHSPGRGGRTGLWIARTVLC